MNTPRKRPAALTLLAILANLIGVLSAIAAAAIAWWESQTYLPWQEATLLGLLGALGVLQILSSFALLRLDSAGARSSSSPPAPGFSVARSRRRPGGARCNFQWSPSPFPERCSPRSRFPISPVRKSRESSTTPHRSRRRARPDVSCKVSSRPPTSATCRCRTVGRMIAVRIVENARRAGGRSPCDRQRRQGPQVREALTS